jgi:hypothetical protein
MIWLAIARIGSSLAYQLAAQTSGPCAARITYALLDGGRRWRRI